MEIELKYGRGKERFRLPDTAAIRFVEPRSVDPPPADGLVRTALSRPIDSAPFEDVVRGRERVVLVVSDKTRSTATDVFLPYLLESLKRAGVPDEKITIVFATGSHEGHTPEEVDRLLGPGVRGRISIVDHDGEDAESHVRVGTTSRGTPLRFQREVVESDCIVLTGAIGFHYFAGFGGGRKSLLPGVAHNETILANHRLMVSGNDLDAPLCPSCANGVLSGNPIHEDALEGARRLNPAFLLNTILAPDGRIADVVAGNPWSAHDLGVEKARHIFGVPADPKAKLVIASCGGDPKDINFIQAHKSLHHAFELVAEDGVLVLLGECSRGIGSDDFFQWFSTLDLRAVAARLRSGFTINAHTAYVAMRKALARRIILVTKIPRDTVTAMGMERADSAEAAVERAAQMLGRIDEVIVVPRASVTIPLPGAGGAVS